LHVGVQEVCIGASTQKSLMMMMMMMMMMMKMMITMTSTEIQDDKMHPTNVTLKRLNVTIVVVEKQ
jgi:hypothetical protein